MILVYQVECKKIKKGSPVSRVLFLGKPKLLSLIWDATHITPLSVYPSGLPKQLSGTLFDPGLFDLSTRKVYPNSESLQNEWALTPLFHPYLSKKAVSFSVTLSVIFYRSKKCLLIRKYGTLCCPDFPIRFYESIERTAKFKGTYEIGGKHKSRSHCLLLSLQIRSMETQFEVVIGLEIHVQLQTNSKAFSSDSIEYGASPNTQISPISLGHPGTLPMHNKAAIDNALKMGLALECDIRTVNHYSRKNYFYADLPKGYQITQFDTPLCNHGQVRIPLADGSVKDIRLTRIHMEEDTGKSMHDQDLYDTLIDFNRAGTALIEIVTEPDIQSGEEAYAFVTEIRRLVRYLEICDGNMEEGSLRCDANISIMPKGSKTFGTKVEVKNMNSISNVKRAIDFEILRQTDVIRSGGTILGETRGFNGTNLSTFSMRTKETVNDYRFFPDPDLPPTIISAAYLADVRSRMPELPATLYARFTKDYALSHYDASVLIDDKDSALYFEKVVSILPHYKQAANWITGSIRAYLNENAMGINEFVLSPKQIAGIIDLVESNKISHTAATQQLFPALTKDPEASPETLLKKLGLSTITDTLFIDTLVLEVLAEFPDKAAAYRSGKLGLLGLFVGEVMKRSQGKADPKTANESVKKFLDLH